MANQATSSGNPGHEPTLARRTHAVLLRPTHHPFHIGSSTSPWQAQIRAQPPSRRPSVFGPLHAAAVPEQQRPALLAPKVATHNRVSSPAGAQAWPVRRNGHRSSLQLASTPPRPSPSFPPLRTPIVPPPLLLPLQLHRLPGHPFPRATACLQLEKRVPLAQSLSGAISPRRNRVSPRPVSCSSSKPPPDCLHCRDPERRLRGREAFGVRQLAGAVEEQQRA